MKENIRVCLPGPGGLTQYDHFQNYLLTSYRFIFLFSKVMCLLCTTFSSSIHHEKGGGWGKCSGVRLNQTEVYMRNV